LGAGCVLGGALAFLFRPSLYSPFDEGWCYLGIARLTFRGIPSYYAGRVFHPLVVRFVASVFHVPIDARPFLWVSAAALIVVLGCLGAYYGLEFRSTPGLWLLLAVTAAIVDQYRNYYWHDLFYAALCALFFLALRANWWLSLPIVFLLYVTRESTIVLVVALVAIAAFRRQWTFCAGALVVGLAGMGVESTLVRHAVPNQHGISIVVLDALKIPYNFAINICGLEFWTNTIATTTGAPRWVANVPAWIRLGQYPSGRFHRLRMGAADANLTDAGHGVWDSAAHRDPRGGRLAAMALRALRFGSCRNLWGADVHPRAAAGDNSGALHTLRLAFVLVGRGCRPRSGDSRAATANRDRGYVGRCGVDSGGCATGDDEVAAARRREPFRGVGQGTPNQRGPGCRDLRLRLAVGGERRGGR
jgi:hypothetical protein